MKTAVAVFGSLAILSGCSSNVTKVSTLNSETPMLSTSSMTPLFKCVADNVIQAHKEKGAFNAKTNPKGLSRLLVIIGDDQFEDGTIRKNSAIDGPLADRNSAQMKAIINRWIPSYILTLPAREIPLLRRNGVKGSSITSFGTLESDIYQALSAQYSADNIVYFSGAFTKLDNESPLLDRGKGSHIKSDGSIGIAYSKGQAERESVLGLSASLGHVGTNTIISSTMIEAKMHKQSSEIKFSFVPGEANLAMSRKIIISEGVQGTQQMLLEAAALWFVGLAYPQDAKLDSCLSSPSHPGKILDELTKWKGLKEKPRIAKLQSLLKQQGVLQSSYEKGVVDKATKEAIKKYDATHGLFYTPHIEKNLDDLYLHLIRLNQARKLRLDTSDSQ